MKRLARFQDRRKPMPAHAEHHSLSSFERPPAHASKVLPGKFVYTTQFHCPLCERLLDIDHGDRIVCECGLYMETYGNRLTVWLRCDDVACVCVS